MKQQTLSIYTPKYPKKTVRGMTLAAAALLTIGTTLGCRTANAEPQIDGAIAIDEPGIEETCPTAPMTTGMIEVAPTPETEEAPVTDGIVAIDGTPTEEPEEVTLMGDVMIGDDMP